MVARPSRPLVMGVVNATPDSFFAPSRASSTEEAVAKARSLLAEGADLIDVGGESTRPVDTVKERVARAAVAAGATLLNDVSGRRSALAAELGVGWVAMHHRGIPAARTDGRMGPGVDDAVATHVLALARAAREAGVGEIYVDPGIGFGKVTADSLVLLAHLGELCHRAHEEGFGVLVGASRKRFLGALPHGGPLGLEERFEGSLAVATYAMVCGSDLVRVHDVRATAQAAMLVRAGEAA